MYIICCKWKSEGWVIYFPVYLAVDFLDIFACVADPGFVDAFASVYGHTK